MYEGQELYDASLESLEMINVPPFDFQPNQMNYQFLLPTTVNTIAVKPKLKDKDGTLEINGNPIDSGAQYTVDIPTGKGEIKIRSTASDGKTTKLYTLSILKGHENEEGVNVARSYSEITASAARSGDQGATYGPDKMVDAATVQCLPACQAITILIIPT